MNGTSFKIETPRSLATQVAQRLRDAIVDGQFALGEMIPEEQLASSFGVSRTPVREALNQLQLLGLVAIKPQRGSYVFEATETDVEALCEFRSLIEPRAAELAYRHARDAAIADIKAAIAEMAAARKGKDGVRYSRADTRLHEAFVAHCGNSYLQAAYATAGAKIAALRTHLSAPADVLRPAGYEQHQQMLAYFSDGDFAAFDALMRVHVAGTRESYVANLKARRAA
ncbi:GntR family transcriptional regulator [Pseudorhodoferax sp. Leaf267]|uniref:GntR family transcriptional regulator n=1 Tax=Pseudorhodoferax sp. Leaf267 TaxID=1736316 RepID=UPI000B31D694|nr:GntR family transcriptional regulator [Pseudorhodoferax sp. Leaf267]